jgi:hypothetical protein
MMNKDPSMTKAEKDIKLLERVGKAMFGPRWQSDLGRSLKVNLRTTRRWYSGKSRVHLKYWEGMLTRAERHLSYFSSVVAALRRRVEEERAIEERLAA